MQPLVSLCRLCTAHPPSPACPSPPCPSRLRLPADAKGRKLTIVKVPCPPAIFRTYKEADGLLVSWNSCAVGWAAQPSPARQPASHPSQQRLQRLWGGGVPPAC